MDLRAVCPRWLVEFKRSGQLRSQIYLYGNLYDSCLFPPNYKTASTEAELKWVRFSDVTNLLTTFYLPQAGFDPVVYYDVIDGFRVKTGDSALAKDGVLTWLRALPWNAGGDASGDRPSDAKSIDQFRTLEELVNRAPQVMTLFRALMHQNQRVAAGIINFGSRLAGNPGSLAENERSIFLKLLKAAEDAHGHADGRRNVLIVFCDKLSDIPAWLLLENPLTKGIEVKKPNRIERGRFFDFSQEKFFQEGAPVKQPDTSTSFVDLTDGLDEPRTRQSHRRLARGADSRKRYLSYRGPVQVWRAGEPLGEARSAEARGCRGKPQGTCHGTGSCSP